ncbi:hypothetical protein Bca4012_044869 [Brassica carinata]|uniref:Uncharacterized protein n=2 Tax=Brassica TaxID=3705 RepID=A0A8X7UGF2_BRACI|nr:hypothetical protein Bca52824_057676 [Brassica carinata]
MIYCNTFGNSKNTTPKGCTCCYICHVSMTSEDPKADEGLTNSVKTYNTTQMAKTWRNEISDTGQANYLAATNTTTQSQIQKQLE